MNTKYLECNLEFDDAERMTYCPHPMILPKSMLAQKDQAFKLLGKMVRFAHLPPGSGKKVTSISYDGMVTIDGMDGEFAPHLFVEDES